LQVYGCGRVLRRGRQHLHGLDLGKGPQDFSRIHRNALTDPPYQYRPYCASIYKPRIQPLIKQGGPAARGLQRYNYRADSLKPQPAYFV
ncbi:MAG: hypothetical protein RLZZ510_1688, partial [Bacteroidota bacterium]